MSQPRPSATSGTLGMHSSVFTALNAAPRRAPPPPVCFGDAGTSQPQPQPPPQQHVESQGETQRSDESFSAYLYTDSSTPPSGSSPSAQPAPLPAGDASRPPGTPRSANATERNALAGASQPTGSEDALASRRAAGTARVEGRRTKIVPTARQESPEPQLAAIRRGVSGDLPPLYDGPADSQSASQQLLPVSSMASTRADASRGEYGSDSSTRPYTSPSPTPIVMSQPFLLQSQSQTQDMSREVGHAWTSSAEAEESAEEDVLLDSDAEAPSSQPLAVRTNAPRRHASPTSPSRRLMKGVAAAASLRSEGTDDSHSAAAPVKRPSLEAVMERQHQPSSDAQAPGKALKPEPSSADVEHEADSADETKPGDGHTGRRRRRTRKEEVERLTAVFAETPFPDNLRRQELAVELNMTFRAVSIWFQNRRQTMKKRAARYGASSDALDQSSSGPAPQTSDGAADKVPYQRAILQPRPTLDAAVAATARQAPISASRSPSAETAEVKSARHVSLLQAIGAPPAAILVDDDKENQIPPSAVHRRPLGPSSSATRSLLRVVSAPALPRVPLKDLNELVSGRHRLPARMDVEHVGGKQVDVAAPPRTLSRKPSMSDVLDPPQKRAGLGSRSVSLQTSMGGQNAPANEDTAMESLDAKLPPALAASLRAQGILPPVAQPTAKNDIWRRMQSSSASSEDHREAERNALEEEGVEEDEERTLRLVANRRAAKQQARSGGQPNARAAIPYGRTLAPTGASAASRHAQGASTASLARQSKHAAQAQLGRGPAPHSAANGRHLHFRVPSLDMAAGFDRADKPVWPTLAAQAEGHARMRPAPRGSKRSANAALGPVPTVDENAPPTYYVPRKRSRFAMDYAWEDIEPQINDHEATVGRELNGSATPLSQQDIPLQAKTASAGRKWPSAAAAHGTAEALGDISNADAARTPLGGSRGNGSPHFGPLFARNERSLPRLPGLTRVHTGPSPSSQLPPLQGSHALLDGRAALAAGASPLPSRRAGSMAHPSYSADYASSAPRLGMRRVPHRFEASSTRDPLGTASPLTSPERPEEVRRPSLGRSHPWSEQGELPALAPRSYPAAAHGAFESAAARAANAAAYSKQDQHDDSGFFGSGDENSRASTRFNSVSPRKGGREQDQQAARLLLGLAGHE